MLTGMLTGVGRRREAVRDAAPARGLEGVGRQRGSSVEPPLGPETPA
jgi:hypothetical protein